MNETRADALLACTVCGVRVERCDFCEREDCPVTICSRCLRTEIRHERNHPAVVPSRGWR